MNQKHDWSVGLSRKKDSTEYMREWSRRNREKTRRYRLMSEYGITLEQYQERLSQQKGLCALCGQPPRGTKMNDRVLNVDHDHVTEQIRGLLCGPCNKGLGLLGDNLDSLWKAIHYLEGAKRER